MRAESGLSHERLIHVAAAAITDPQGRVLISKRPDHVHQGGLWEFPGGKLEAGEQVLAGLARELREELNIGLRRAEPLIRITHHYADRGVRLEVFRVREYSGVPTGMEGQPLTWVSPEAMRAERFPAADRPVITALRLPSLYLITGPDPARPAVFLRRLRQALEQGVKLVQLRAHQLSDPLYEALARSAHETCRARDAALLLSRPDRLWTWADGVHLNARQLMALPARPSCDGWVGASCHNPLELQRAETLGLDYALLSPVAPTSTHPDVTPLGWESFAHWVEAVNLPVYALGGLGEGDLDQARQCGAQGIAAISGLWCG